MSVGGRSLGFWYSNLEKHKCGYCKDETGNISHGMWMKTLTPDDYQNLIDRGWRRSGNYCYKPVMDQICCPMYTIKCDVVNFSLSKSQKRVLKKFNKFLKDGELDKRVTQQVTEDSMGNVSEFVYREAPKCVLEQTQAIDTDIRTKENNGPGICRFDISSQSDSINDADTLKGTSPLKTEKPSTSDQVKQLPKSGIGADPSKPQCKKAKFLRMERKREKLLQRGMSLEKIDVRNAQKQIEEFVNEAPTDGIHKLKLELIHTGNRSKEWEKLEKVEFALYKKYQMAIHNDPPEKCKMEGFVRFLVDSPLQHVKFSKDSDLGYGSFHQLYWLGDKLIAVGVIDILPKCVSAVYFFYDPEYRDLTVGTYGALREVEFTRSVHKKIPSIDNYYMGFYIHSCPKMRYKGNLTPSYLLCPETYQWAAIENCSPKLDVHKYSRLNEDETATDGNACSDSDIDDIKLLIKRTPMSVGHFKRKYEDIEDFSMIGRLIGRACSRSIIFIFGN